MVKTFYLEVLPVETFKQYALQFEAMVPEMVLKFLKRQKQILKYQQGLLSFILMRYILHTRYNYLYKDIILTHGESGKPYLKNENVFFNLSHSGEIVTGAFSNKEIGVDIEKRREIRLDLAKRFYSEQEFNDLLLLSKDDQKEYFFELWTLKESYIKFTGEGLHQGLNTFSIRKENNVINLNDEFHGFEGINFFQPNYFEEYKYAICTLENNISEKIEQINPMDFLLDD